MKQPYSLVFLSQDKLHAIIASPTASHHQPQPATIPHHHSHLFVINIMIIITNFFSFFSHAWPPPCHDDEYDRVANVSNVAFPSVHFVQHMAHYSLFKPHSNSNFTVYGSSVVLQLSYFLRLILPISFVSILWSFLQAGAKQGGFSVLEHIEKGGGRGGGAGGGHKKDEPGGGNIA